jgi:putative DNA methylase
VDRAARTITYRIRKDGTTAELARAKEGTKAGRGAHFRCLLSDTAITPDYVKTAGREGRMGQTLIAIVAEGKGGRVYAEPTEAQEELALSAKPEWKPEQKQPENPRWFSPPDYGMTTFGDLFTDRQLVALNTFSDLVHEARVQIEADAREHGLSDDPTPLRQGGKGAKAYAEAVSVYLGFMVGQVANHCSTVCGWNSPNQQMRSTFSIKDIPTTWDFAEVNVFSESSGRFHNLFTRMIKGFLNLVNAAITQSSYNAMHRL